MLRKSVGPKGRGDENRSETRPGDRSRGPRHRGWDECERGAGQPPLGPADITTYSPSLEELSGVVWAAAGINRPGTDRLTAPSALALYPVRVYAFFAEGVYRYDARTHKLVRVLEGDRRKLTGMQDFVFAAPLNLVYLADRTVYEGRNIPAEHVRYLCGQDAAGYAENVNLYTAGHGLRSITRGSVPEAELLAALGLEPARWFVALAQTVGK